MDRRELLLAIGAGLAIAPVSAIAQNNDAFARALGELAGDVEAIQAANRVRERFQRVEGDPVGAGQASSWRRASDTRISPRARELIIVCEVSSQTAYENRYQHPVRPGGQSGITIGIGYDLGYASPEEFGAQWASLLDPATISTLSSVCGLKGDAAQTALPSVRSSVVPWTQAVSQFDGFLRYAVGKTEDTFRNSVELHPASLGALVSLVYNRGPSLSASSERRTEMREIARLTRERNFALIPSQIRKMTRLWESDPSTRGLVRRRELEALLFEEGLA